MKIVKTRVCEETVLSISISLVFWNDLKNAFHSIESRSYPNPCETPITYRKNKFYPYEVYRGTLLPSESDDEIKKKPAESPPVRPYNELACHLILL